MRTSILHGHHIIPEHCAGHPALEGVDINAPANIVYLPASRQLADEMGVSPHSGGHLESYYAACKELDKITRNSNPALWLKEIEDLQDAMRIALANGDLFTNKPSTGADTTPINKSLLAGRGKYLVDHPEEHKKIRELRQRGAVTGQSHLIKWSPYWDNLDRQEQLTRAIANNPDLNVTADNRDLDGTHWSKFAALDPSSSNFHIPGSTPANPSDFPSLPGYSSPSLAGMNEQERLTQVDPRFNSQLPGFPAPGRDEQQFAQLPPTAATPPDPLVLRSDPASGTALPFYENPLAGGSSLARDALPWLAGAAAVGAAAPFIPAWLLTIGGILTLSRAANAQDSSPDAKIGAASPGGVFSTGATAFDTLSTVLKLDQADRNSGHSASKSGLHLGGAVSLDPEAHANTFADRFGNWASTPSGTVPAERQREAGPVPSAKSVAPEDVRRLARVNASNAGSAFTSGSSPVPYLPSTEFNERFGSWTVPTADGQPPLASKPIDAFADEPSYLIPPPIFGVDGPGNPRNDAEEWFSRWIRPLIHPE